MIANTSGVLLRTMLFLVQNNHVMNEKRIDTNTLYHIKTGESHATTKCFGNMTEYGCYSLGEPWTSEARPISQYPEPPEVLDVLFCLYSRRNRTCQLLDVTEPASIYRSSLVPGHRTYLLAHGFLESGEKPWLQLMKDRLLERADVNVIIVDWGRGSGPPYNQAVANTRMVGYMAARLLYHMKMYSGVNPELCHFIGHSLGAHLAGYAGYHLRQDFNLKLGRITGMDPAQPHFSNTDPLVRLDPTDAVFVDVIHTDAIDHVTGGFGIEEPIGHLDFYPNGGNNQPGCEQNILSFISKEDGSLFKGIKKFIGCNHVRAHEFFSETILRAHSSCGFWGVECESYDKFRNGSCFACTAPGHHHHGNKGAGHGLAHVHSDHGQAGPLCARMGLEAGQKRFQNAGRPVRLYLLTGAEAPFCRWLYLITVQLSSSNKSVIDGGEVGKINVSLRGDVGVAKDMHLYDRETYLAPGSLHQRVVSGARVGTVHSVTITFEYVTSFNPLTWRFFEVTKIHVASITVEPLSVHGHERLKLCTKDDTLMSGKPVTLTRANDCG
ncbi:pancreatic lipase-related protein 2-like [Frankliniella occidentalis]|uniref:Pancreatic lipase-related protein 2-like n=1 Tax=Frankliniella occidentalis TaxID=133901 RepID=A0A9C6X6D9_FRAOC|nr:pancreatic lipase-related protein 2-like [Frankliniella occidentalis]